MSKKSRYKKFVGSLEHYIDPLKSNFKTLPATNGIGLRELLSPYFISIDRVPEEDKFLVELIQNIPFIQLHINDVFRKALRDRLRHYEQIKVS